MDASPFSTTDQDERRALVRQLLARRGLPSRAATAIPERPAGMPLRMSLPQRRLWFLDQLQPGTSAYNLSAALALSGSLDVRALERALAIITARHDALRMAFPARNAEAAVEIQGDLKPTLERDDLSALSPAERDTELHRRLDRHAHAPFDLARGPLVRLALLRVGADEHVLALAAHHIVFDGWSISLFIRELAAAYSSALTADPPPLPALPIGYADFAAWQRDQMDAGALEEHLAYWTQQLAGLPTLDLRTDRPRPPVPTRRGSGLTFRLSAALTAGLRRLARDHDATLFMALAAGFFALLARYTGQTDIAIGCPIAGRSRPELEGLIGLFANTLVLRADLAGEPSFVELLGRVRRMTLDAYAHQDAPFEALVERLQPERRLAQQPLFQVAFAMQEEGIAALALPGIQVRVIDVPSRAAKFDLTIALTLDQEGLSGSAEFSTEIFDDETIGGLARHYATLLAGALEHPGLPIGRLPLLSTDERRRVLGWSGGAKGATIRELLHESFERQVVSAPDAIAVRDGVEQLTYAALNARANRLARHLRGLGIGAEDRVGLCVERSAQTVMAILGILKAGAAYVPIDPVNPAERVSLIVRDSGAALVLTDEIHAPRLTASGARVLTLAGIEQDLEEEDPSNLDRLGPPDSLAYIIYTSGSTGRPKGTLIQHDHVQRLFSETDQWFRFGRNDVWTLFHSYGFDFSVWELWGALAYGGRLVVVPYRVSRSPEEFYELVSRERITVLNQTPSAFRQLVDAEGRRPEVLPLALRYVIFGGEALDLETLRPWFDRHGDGQPCLVNMYGITETTVHVTYRPLTRQDVEARAGSVIGRPIPDLRVLVLDRHLEPVPPGISGELFVGGAGVARGYLDRPELTAERFVPDPFDAAGGRLYRSGDLARYTFAGDLQYLGRIDQQVKIRGHRIELGEIEHALRAHDGVRHALVVAPDDGGGRRLVAYVTPSGDPRPSSAALRRHLQASLPDYMLPAAVVVIDALPLTPHGKVDLRALPAAADEWLQAGRPHAPPTTPAEKILAEVWGAVLGIPEVGVTDNFFELGGDSILSIKVLALARERGVELSLQALFEHQTIAALVAASTTDIGDPQIALEPPAPYSLLTEPDRALIAARFGHGAEDAYPLTRLQQGMLFRSNFSEFSTAYHNVSSFTLGMGFERDRFEDALGAVIARHPVLRTSLHQVGFSQPLQIVHASIGLPLTVDDLRALDELEQERRIGTWLEADRQRRFDVETAPLFRVHVHLRRRGVVQITLTEHHAILDGWSVATLLSELMTAYLGLPDAPGDLGQPRSRFAEHVRQEGEALASPEAVDFWTRYMEGNAPAPLPRLAGATREPGVLVHETELAADTIRGLDALAQRERVPFRTALLAAHSWLVGYLGGTGDVVTGLVVNARPEAADGERALGLFLNTVPLRIAVHGGTWRTLLSEVFAAERAVLPFRAYPMSELQRAAGGAPIFNTAFNYVHFHVYERLARVPGLEVLGQSGFAETDVPLAASFSRDVTSGTVRLSLECASPALDGPALARLAEYYHRTLEALAGAADGRYDAWTPLSAHDIATLRDWSRGAERPAADVLAPDLIALRAQESPGADAVRMASATVTYGALDARAARAARVLRGRGVTAGAKVALLAEATPDLVAAMLGVWKAGAAFVPLDPLYPRERLQFIVTDASPAVVVSAGKLALPIGSTTATRLTFDDLFAETDVADEGPGSIDPDQLAYVIYTSGSTGAPKGVMVTHGGLRNLLQGQIPRFDLDRHSRVLQYAALGFDAAISEIFTTLGAGGTLVLAERADLRDPEALAGILTGEAITTVTLPPTMLTALGAASLPALSTIVSAGEPCRQELVERWARGRRLLNAYGPTETTVCATMTGPLADDELGPPIGRPLDNVETWVLDRFLAPAPIGVAGELHVAGASLARGYLGRPDLTAAQFVPHPFECGARLYRTGDLVRWRPDGQLEFVGRTDAQVKIRGVRVELGEIEAVLQAHPNVRMAAVLLREDGGGPRLVAYVEPAGPPPSVDSLRSYAEARLPEAAIPAIILVLDRLPQTPSGKIDRRALPAPAADRPMFDRDYVAPRTPTEEALAAIWAGVLRVDRVGVHDNFFRLGGDSILSLQVVSRARAGGLRISPQQVFAQPTVAALAALADTGGGALGEGRPEGLVPLTPIQQWFFTLEIPARHHWNQALLLQVPATTDSSRLERALRAVAAHHDGFRLRFVEEAGGWVQHYATGPGDCGFEMVALDSTPALQRPAEIERHASGVQRGLDLQHGPLFRAAHYRLGDDPGRLLLVAHHLVVDGVSWRMLLDDLQMAYTRLAAGEPVALPPVSASFKSWAMGLQRLASTDDVRQSARFWTRADEAPDPGETIVTDGWPAANQEADAQSLDVWLDAERTRDLLHEVPRAYHTETPEVVLTAFAQVLADWTGLTRMRLAIEGHGREVPGLDLDLSRSLGWFTAAYPVVIDLTNTPAPGDALKAVKEQLRAVPHKGVSYGLLALAARAGSDNERQAARGRSGVSFNYLGQLDATLSGGSSYGAAAGFAAAAEPTGASRDPEAQRPHLLDLVVSIEGGRLRATWVYPSRLLTREDVQRGADGLISRLRQLITHCLDPTAGGYTESDFPEMDFGQDELAALLDALDKRTESA